MSPNSLITSPSFSILVYAQTGNKDTESRLRLFSRWLDKNTLRWYQPDLAAYRDKLLEDGKRSSSVSSHLSTIRGAYRRLLLDDAIRDALYRITPEESSPADRKALVDEMIIRISNAIDPQRAPLSLTVRQDYDDRAAIRLTDEQASRLLSSPDTTTLKGLRDVTLLATLLCTGIREGELVALDVSDLYGSLGGEPALHIRYGKGNKSRLVPFGDMIWCLQIIKRWLAQANIQQGPVFRGFYKGSKRIRQTALTTRAVQYILGSYPIQIADDLIYVRPHDCRRTYARRLYEAGMELVAIQQNLGHSDVKTTLRYIGTLGAKHRRSKALYGFDMDSLDDGGR